ncbi:MAG: allophanate hydrolase, partial [Betaproteobacteria bacterium]|nr:allophanate hydrolase [Betaproteobacteria bacterium]
MSLELSSLPFDLASLRAAYESGLQPQDVVREVYRRIAAKNDPGVFIYLRDEASVIADTTRLGPCDPAKPLWGMPFAIKDNIDYAGVATSAGCPDFTFTPHRHATSVQRLVDAGALAIGKTNLDQFATGLVGVRTPFPAPLNPFDEKIVPGGSSSGSAVAVANGFVSFSLGTDTAGSG